VPATGAAFALISQLADLRRWSDPIAVLAFGATVFYFSNESFFRQALHLTAQ
jgi:hypothetical protein